MTHSILLVDDIKTFHDALTPLILNEGFSVTHAYDGIEAMQQLEVHTEVVGIITDVQMPRMSGVELLQGINRLPRTYPTYVHSSEGRLRHNGEEVELAAFITTYFGEFASFMRKDSNMAANVSAFLKSLPR